MEACSSDLVALGGLFRQAVRLRLILWEEIDLALAVPSLIVGVGEVAI